MGGESGPMVHLAELLQPLHISACPRGTQTAFWTRKRLDLRQSCSALLLLLLWRKAPSWRTPQLPRQRPAHLLVTSAASASPMLLQTPAPLAPAAACSALHVLSADFCSNKDPLSLTAHVTPSHGVPRALTLQCPRRTGTGCSGRSWPAAELTAFCVATTWLLPFVCVPGRSYDAAACDVLSNGIKEACG